jgi:hypothetical protein
VEVNDPADPTYDGAYSQASGQPQTTAYQEQCVTVKAQRLKARFATVNGSPCVGSKGPDHLMRRRHGLSASRVPDQLGVHT